MARLTNKQMLEQMESEPNLEGGTEEAVEKVRTLYPDGKILEAEKDENNVEVTVGFRAVDGQARLLEVTIGPDGSVLNTDERPDTVPGEDVQPDEEQTDDQQEKKSRASQARERKGRK